MPFSSPSAAMGCHCTTVELHCCCAMYLLGTFLTVWLLLPKQLASGSLKACQAAKHSQGTVVMPYCCRAAALLLVILAFKVRRNSRLHVVKWPQQSSDHAPVFCRHGHPV